MGFKYLFGPVASRRLGISLGVDLIPAKTCSLDCVYCECGQTSRLTLERAEHVPAGDVITELQTYLGAYPPPDYITFSGAGEPTLHSGLGRIARWLKAACRIPLALITNATLLPRPEVRRELLDLDLILPSLDAASPAVFAVINRPHPELSPGALISGLAALREEFAGQIWLEIFLIHPVNTTPEEIGLLQVAIDRIRPDRVQLNSLDRPGTEGWVRKAPPEVLEAVARDLRHPRVEIISRFHHRREIPQYRSDLEEAILEAVSRRPCTMEDLVLTLGAADDQLRRYLDVLELEHRIRPEIQDRGIFFRAVRKRP